MNLKMLVANDLDRAALLASPALVATLPATNLQRARRDAVARSTSAADQAIYATWPDAVAVDALGLWGHNLTSSGTWRARLYAAADATGSPLYDSGARAALPAKALGDLGWGLDPLGAAWPMAGSTPHAVLWLDAPYLARSARFDLSDAANPAGYLEAQRLYVGRAFAPAVNFDWGAKLAYQDDSAFTRSERGSLFVAAGPRYRKLTFALGWLTDAEALRLGEEIGAAGKAGDVLISLYPADPSPGRRLQYTLAARLDGLPEFSSAHPHINATSITVQEI